MRLCVVCLWLPAVVLWIYFVFSSKLFSIVHCGPKPKIVNFLIASNKFNSLFRYIFKLIELCINKERTWNRADFFLFNFDHINLLKLSSMGSLEDIKRNYPLHWLVWTNEHQQLQELLQTEQVNALLWCKYKNREQHFTFRLGVKVVDEPIQI